MANQAWQSFQQGNTQSTSQPISQPQATSWQQFKQVSSQPVVTSQPQQPQQSLISKAKPLIEQAKPVAKNLFEQGKSFVKSVPGYVKAAVKNPIQTVGGVGQAVVFDFGGSVANAVEKGAAKVIGVKVPERWDISKQQKAFKDWGKENVKAQGEDKAKAFEAGEFIGAFIPYTIASEVAALSIGSKIATPIITRFLPKAKFLIPKISNVIGFSGVGQLEYDKEIDGERIDRLKNDVIMLGLFEGGGFLANKISKKTTGIISKTYNEVSSKLKSGKSVAIDDLEKAVTETKQIIAKETGKPAGVTLANNIANASEKEIAALSPVEKTKIPKAIAEQDLYLQAADGEVRKIPQSLKEDFWRLDNEGLSKGKDWHVTAGLTPEKIQRAGLTIGKDADQTIYSELKSKIKPVGETPSGTKDTPLPSPTEAKSPLNENVKLVEEALASGDIDGAKQLYKDLPKEGYMPSFEDIKKGFDRTNDHFTAKDANREAKDLNEGYGAFQKDVQNFKSKLRAAADQKNSSGMLNREHMPKDMFGGNSMASDDVATRLGMTENQFMEKLINELDVKKGGVPKAPKEVAVPREQLPIGEGKEKVSKLEARMKGVIGKATQEQKDELGLSTFNQMNNKDTIKKAAEFAINNPKDAIKVLEGKMEVPAGLNSNSIFVAMANNPELTSELAIKLASLKSTAMGQNIEILKALNKNNPVAIASDIYKIKEAEFSKRYGGKTIKEVTDKYIEKGQKEIKPPKISDWGSIIKEVRC